MTVRNLEFLLRPASVALVGASNTPGSVGAVIARNLLGAGFGGPVMPVNPKHSAVHGVLCYPDVASLPQVPDLAVIATPPETVPGLLAALGVRGTRAAVVVGSGFNAGGAPGRALVQAALEAARPHLLRVVGPNCLGILVPGHGLNASFAQLNPRPGRLAFLAQSGAIVTSVVDWAHERGIGFSHLVSLGDMIDVDFGDLLDYLATDAATQAILLYLETVTHARKFLSAARAASRMKPVVVVKGGRHAEGARAAASHTGALAGSDAVYDAVFRRAGMLRVITLEELFDAVGILGYAQPAKGDRLAILSNGGGAGVLATDALVDHGGPLATLGDDTLARLDAVLPPTWSRGNPVDIIGDATGARYRDALAILLDAPEVDAVLVLHCPTAVASSLEAAQAVVATIGDKPKRAVLTSWIGDLSVRAARALFVDRRIPTYDTPEAAVRAFMYTVRHRRSQELLSQTPPSVPEEFQPDTTRARALIDLALAGGGGWLGEDQSKELLAAYAIPIAAVRHARTPDAAAQAAAEFGAPVALKIRSPDLTHKSAAGGVALDLEDATVVREQAQAMLERLRRSHPEARLEGFTVGPMVWRAGALELIAGMFTDRQFGPVILIGRGGVAVEAIDDTALGLPPLNMYLAAELLADTRVHRELRGAAGRPAADLDAIALTLIKLSQLAADLPEVAELDINPLLADRDGVIALDARVRVEPARGAPGERLAIRPYPKELEEDVTLADGRRLWLRPIRPEDEPALQAAFAHFTPEQIRLRFFVPLKTLSHNAAARLTQIDYDREMALALTERGIPGKAELYGVVRIKADPDVERGEFAIIVREAVTGQGLGHLLMQRIIDYARGRGMREIYGEVLHENRRMLALCDAFGFERRSSADDPMLVHVSLRL
jgi:acetyltransferase